MMGIHSLRPIRRYFYKYFYLAHTALMPIIVVFLWLHMWPENYLFPIPITFGVFMVYVKWSSFRSRRILRSSVHGSFVKMEIEKIPGSNDGGDHANVYMPSLDLISFHPFCFYNTESSSVFLIKSYKNWTKKLHKKVNSSIISNSAIGNLRINGPYHSLLRYVTFFQRIVLFGAGGGVVPMVSALNSIAMSETISEKAESIDFIFISPNVEEVTLVDDEIKAMCANEPAKMSHLESKINKHLFATKRDGRPDTTKLIPEILKNLLSEKEEVGFFFCGPLKLDLSVKKSLVALQLKNPFKLKTFFMEADY